MVAFWNKDPRAPATPTKGYPHLVWSEAGTEIRSTEWPAKFAQVLPKIVNHSQRESERARDAEVKADSDVERTHVRFIDAVFESVKPIMQESRQKGENEVQHRHKRRRRLAGMGGITPGLDLLGDNIFSFFGALDSGVGSGTGCSLNCGGNCPICKSRRLADIKPSQ